MTIPVVLLSDFNIGVFERYLRHDESEPVVDVEAAPFGQLFPSLAAGPVRRDTVAVVWTRPEGVLPAFREAFVDGAAIDGHRLDDDVDDIARLLGEAAGRHRHLLMASWVSAPGERGHGMLDWRPGAGFQHALARANLRLAEQLADVSNAHLLDAEAWIRAAGLVASPKQWFTSKVPYVNAVFEAAVPEVKAALVAITSAPRKLVIVDLDDTLWGGVVGDVGWEALRLGGHDHVGEAYLDFQRALRALTARGVLLGVVSKNTEDVALEAIDRHPEMAIRRDDLAGWRISWDDKAAGIAALIDDLNLGPEAVVFIDDNPAERDRVRDALPKILVPDWPAEPAHFAGALRSLRCFDRSAITDEDRARSDMYVTDRERRASQTTVGTLDDWLAGLGLHVVVSPVGDANIERVAQLLNKTNQMNLTTRRASSAELAAWASRPGHQLLALNVSDRFGDAGLTGVVGIESVGSDATLTDFVLSCRVMGRRVEEVMLHVATLAARAAGATAFIARHVPTDRNQPCLDFLRRSALEESEPHAFRGVGDAPCPLPGFVTLDVGALPALTAAAGGGGGGGR